MIIRPILPDDVYSVLAIEYGAFMQPYPPELMNYLYSHYRDTFLVAEMGSAIVGYVVAIPDELEIHIISIAVADGYRGQGVGSALMRGIMAIFDTGIPFSIRLEVRESNKGAQRFYMRLGFSVAYTIQYYYEDGEAAKVMIWRAADGV